MSRRIGRTVNEIFSEIRSQSAQELINSVLHEGAIGSLVLEGQTSPFIFKRGDVLEVQGSTGSGKTRFLYDIAFKCILPSYIDITIDNCPERLSLGGWEKNAIMIDADGRWKIAHFYSEVFRRLENLVPKGSLDREQFVRGLALRMLRNLHIFCVTSTITLSSVLDNLPAYHSLHIPNAEISLLMIDSISAFYWQDRHSMEQNRRTKQAASDSLGNVLRSLQTFRLRYGPVIVMTNWGLSFGTEQPNEVRPSEVLLPVYRQHLQSFPAPFGETPRIFSNANLMPPITYHVSLLQKHQLLPMQAETAAIPEITNLVKEWITDENNQRIYVIFRIVETGERKLLSFKLSATES